MVRNLIRDEGEVRAGGSRRGWGTMGIARECYCGVRECWRRGLKAAARGEEVTRRKERRKRRKGRRHLSFFHYQGRYGSSERLPLTAEGRGSSKSERRKHYLYLHFATYKGRWGGEEGWGMKHV